MIGNDVWQAAEFLRQGKLVAIPTETVYGLAGNALDGEAVAAIFETKGRPSFNPLIVHISGLDVLDRYCEAIPELLMPLAERYMPGPLTLLLNKKETIPDLVTAGSERVAIRIPRHTLTQQLLSILDFPLAAPSANPFGYISPTTAQHVQAQLGDKIPYILDGGPCEVGLESTIVGIGENGITIYRKGGLAIEDVEAITGPVFVMEHSASQPDAPGMLSSHYAPRRPLIMGDLATLVQKFGSRHIAVITFKEEGIKLQNGYVRTLSPKGDLREAAQNLFGVLRECDEMPVQMILAEWMPERGLGRAINDRLKRASVGIGNT
ncbi:MAG: L-threonylcarbamoyladenylate synthase [Saprospiraceae bacterium]|nr:L-threonylcarbamoyladenylate synthase [Saprospiraceae bacterium]